MGESEGRYDEVLMGLASQHADVMGLLRTFFSFLHRKTDFYVVDPSQTRPIGFAPGAAEALMLRAFRGLPYKAPRDLPLAQASSQSSRAEVDRLTSLPKPRMAVLAPARDVASKPTDTKDHSTGTIAALTDALDGAAQPPGSSNTRTRSIHSRLAPSGKQVPIANGGVGPGYWWTQTLSEVTIYAALPKSTRSKDVVCTVTSHQLSISLRVGGATQPRVVVSGTFPGAVRHTESIWSLTDDEASSSSSHCAAAVSVTSPGSSAALTPQSEGEAGKVLSLALEKCTPTWWVSALQGDPEIEGSMIDSTVSMGEYDDETQAAIRKIMFEQTQQLRARDSEQQGHMLPPDHDALTEAASD